MIRGDDEKVAELEVRHRCLARREDILLRVRTKYISKDSNYSCHAVSA